MRIKKKHLLDKRLRNKLKRRFAKENSGSIIGRPKKPPIMGSEKTDGKSTLFAINLCRRRIKDIYMPRLRMWQNIPRLIFP
jgi:hypothetical protein